MSQPIEPPRGPALPDHPLRSLFKCTAAQARMLVAMLPGDPHQYLLGRQLVPFRDKHPHDQRALQLRNQARYFYDDDKYVCFHWVESTGRTVKMDWGNTMVISCRFFATSDDCRYEVLTELMSIRTARKEEGLPLVIPREPITYPPGERPDWDLPSYACQSLAFIGDVRPNGPAPAPDDSRWLLDDDEEDQRMVGDDLGTAHINWDQRVTDLFGFFRTPAGVPFAAYFLREILEYYTILGKDANDALLVEIKSLGQLAPGQTQFPRPNDDHWTQMMDSLGSFLHFSNPEPYFEQAQIGGKQHIARDILGLPQLRKAYAHLNINWHKCCEIVDGRRALTGAYMEATDMEVSRMPAPLRAATAPIMRHIIPNRIRRDQRREEAKAAREKEAASQASSSTAGPAHADAPGWDSVRGHVSRGDL
ncbi:hypothetical protein CALCODRAFT_507466 [Calocera cornea HHB12733]|uniref:Uncharacterized protein n=1 Tax=Calocera cornea HHB12733 TaxID=1353952 RepID=A0A165HQC9_9BASI|nr:hypothetical protein CALCODRAFT_507466 [Calocera cornea HHB12733]